MKRLNFILFFLSVSMLASCIKDDFIADTIDTALRITTNLETLAIDTEFQFEAMYLNEVGQETDVPFFWTSSDESIILISENGLAQAISPGTVTITVTYIDGENELEDKLELSVGESTTQKVNTVTSNIVTTSSYVLEGEFTYAETPDGVNIAFKDDYKASTALPGLYLYLSNNKSSIADALEIGAVEVFNGAHEYDVDDVEFSDFKYLVYFCKPFNVKVGDGELNF